MASVGKQSPCACTGWAGRQSGQGVEVSTSSSARRRKFRRTGGFGSAPAVATRSARFDDALGERSSDFRTAAASHQCVSGSLAQWANVPSYARMVGRCPPSFHAAVRRTPPCISEFADAVFDWCELPSTFRARHVRDGKPVPSAGSARARKAGGSALMAADNAFAATVSANAPRGYDAAQKQGLAPRAQFDPITVMNKTWAPERPQAGGGNTGHEP